MLNNGFNFTTGFNAASGDSASVGSMVFVAPEQKTFDSVLTMNPIAPSFVTAMHVNNATGTAGFMVPVAPMGAVYQFPPMYAATEVYAGPTPQVLPMSQKVMPETNFFMSESMRTAIMIRNELSNLLLGSAEEIQNYGLPLEVAGYHTLYPLEPMMLPLQKNLAPVSTFKVTHGTTGVKYCIRVLHGFILQSTKCMQVVDMWKKFQHTNIVHLCEVFTTKAFGDNSLVLIYNLHPGSETLEAKYFMPTHEHAITLPSRFEGDARPYSYKKYLYRNKNGPLLPEATIWDIIIQLTAGLHALHQAGLACRNLDPTKIIITDKRVRFSFCGLTDIAQFDPNAQNTKAVIAMHQQEDLRAFGRLVLALSCRCLEGVTSDNVQNSIQIIGRQYSSDLLNFILYLFNTTQYRSVAGLMAVIGPRVYTQLDALQTQCDMQEDELAKEMDNGRLYRILVKLNSIIDRPDFNLDSTWAETGDRYVLKLFRDYLFHSVTGDGRPWLDHAHIVQCLNKLDAGTMERVQLMSRDEQSLLIVSYAEIKSGLDKAFAELTDSVPA